MNEHLHPWMGKKVRDEITGFEGMVTGHADYITGCDQFLVQPECKEDGKFVQNRWFDEQRLMVIGGD